MSGDFSDFVDIAVDVGSVVATDGAEFLANTSVTEFGFPVDLVDTVGFEQAGSFAGNASWFDTFNPGDIVSQATDALSGFSLDSITSSLPSLSDIKSFASGVQSDFSGFVKQAQGAIQAYQKVAPAVNAASNALGIQNPVNQIIAPVSQAVGVAGAAAGASRSISTTTATTPLISKSAVSANSDAQFNELDARQTAELEAKINPAYRNSLIDPSPVSPAEDPSAENVTTYDAATLSKAELTTLKQQYETAIASNEQNIANANKNIEEMQANLQDPNLSPGQRALLQTQIDNNQAAIAQYTDAYASNLSGLSNVNDQLANDNRIIDQTDNNVTNAPTGVDPTTLEGYGVAGTPPIIPNGTTITPVDPTTLEGYGLTPTGVTAATTSITGVVPNVGDGTGAVTQALTDQLRNQNAIRNLRTTKAQSSDWRVKLSLAPGADYLYKASTNVGEILYPLKLTDGVIFPYTPAIETAYKANYSAYDLTHSNYRGYFYQNSYVDTVNLRCSFTAQDTEEANYLLAVIHFFRSVTKMFYGQDSQRGSPPPLVYLSGLGDYQFAEHPAVVSQFNYTLPTDVDYIRAGSAIDNGTNFLANRTRTTIASNPLSYAVNRLLNAGLFPGAQPNPEAPGNLPVGTPTYVPTKIEIAITLLPIQSRQQVSTQFSLKGFANGNLLKGGFW